MSKAMNSNKIVLGLLNHYNRDLHTSRTFEIPACGAFMLMERTQEQQKIFNEGVEAEYFGSIDEAVEKIKYYLTHEEERKQIAQAGHQRCTTSAYSYNDRAKTAIDIFHSLT
jgi:spore maturation protein CgeB